MNNLICFNNSCFNMEHILSIKCDDKKCVLVIGKYGKKLKNRIHHIHFLSEYNVEEYQSIKNFVEYKKKYLNNIIKNN